MRALDLLVIAALLTTGCARAVPKSRASAEALIALETPSKKPPAFPPNCKRAGKVALIAIEPLTTIDIEAVAARYRKVFGLEVEVLPAVPAAAGAFNAARRQHDAALLIGGFYEALKVPPADASRWIIGVTDLDLFWAERDWRYCFSLRSEHGAVVSTARTASDDPLESGDRTLKLITRVLGETYCGLERGGPDDSVLRPTLMSVDDLDRIDESVWIPAPLEI